MNSFVLFLFAEETLFPNYDNRNNVTNNTIKIYEIRGVIFLSCNVSQEGKKVEW